MRARAALGLSLTVLGLLPMAADAQYVVFRNVAVTNRGAPVTVKVHPGLDGYAQLNGMQIAQASLAPVGSAGGRMNVQLFGKDASRTYVIQASTNLVDWATVGSAIADGAGNVSFTDPDSDKHPARFYRAVEQ
jgi:hypothetical protein